MGTLSDFQMDHIGVAVHDLDLATQRYKDMYNTTVIAEEEVAHQGVVVRFLKHRDKKIELLKALHADSPVGRFLQKRGEGIHHIAYRVVDIEKEMKLLKTKGLQLLQEKPVRGAMNKWVCFVHPKSIGGMLVELCQPMESGHK